MAKKRSKPPPPAAPAADKPPRSKPLRTGGTGFSPGNPGGPGGAREGAGRKPDLAKQATRDYFAGKLVAADKALNACLVAFDEPKVLIKAAELVYAYAHGRPIQRIEQTGGSERARELLDAVDKRELEATAALGSTQGSVSNEQGQRIP